MRTFRRLFGVSIVVTALTLCSSASAEHSPVPPVPLIAVETLDTNTFHDLLPALRQGGHVIYFRHAATRLDQEDQQPVTLGNCATQRNLSDDGRKQADAIGVAFRRLAIPVAKVVTSPFCRTLETAKRAFGGGEVSDDLYFAVGLNKQERAAKGAALHRLLTKTPPVGSNTIIVAHTANLEEAEGIWPKPEGAAILFRPDGQGGLRTLGRIPPELWPALGTPRRGSSP